MYELVDDAVDEKQLARIIARYGRVDLLVIDELGDMELNRRGAELLFQVFTEREEKASVGIGSNEAFIGWIKKLTGPRRCAAIVDGLTFNGTIIQTGTDSYRLDPTRPHGRQPRSPTGPGATPDQGCAGRGACSARWSIMGAPHRRIAGGTTKPKWLFSQWCIWMAVLVVSALMVIDYLFPQPGWMGFGPKHS